MEPFATRLRSLKGYVPLRWLLFGLLLVMATSLFAGSGIHGFTLNSIDGKPAPLADYKGKVVLLVNVASQCGYTPQYTALEAIYEKYKDQGFVILGFPANNFGAQEPGTNEEIKTFCSRKYNVTFPMYAKISVKGSDQAPLYAYLTKGTQTRHSRPRSSNVVVQREFIRMRPQPDRIHFLRALVFDVGAQ